MCGTGHCWSIYYLFPFFHLSSIFQILFMCQAELSTWEKKMPRTQPLPSGSCQVWTRTQQRSPRPQVQDGAWRGAGPAVGAVRLHLPGGLPSAVSAPLPLTSLAFHFHRIDYYLVKVFGLSPLIIPSFVFSL